jgi:hypothetical protein
MWTDRVADHGVVAVDPADMPPSRQKVTCLAGEYCFGIVGEASYQPALRRISGGRRERGEDVEFEALVQREPDNAYDSNAVCVAVNGVGTVGYFRRDEAARAQSGLSKLEAEGQLLVCPAFLIGGGRRKYLGALLDLDFNRLEMAQQTEPAMQGAALARGHQPRPGPDRRGDRAGSRRQPGPGRRAPGARPSSSSC